MNDAHYTNGDDVSIDLKSLLAAVWRAKRWILPSTLIVCVLTALVLNLITPRYLGQAKVLIESNKAVFAERREQPQESERALLDPQGVASQVQLLTSRDLARRVAKKLKLSERAEFNPAGKGATSFLNDMMVLFGLLRDPLRISPEERVLEAYFDRLKVFNVEKSRVIVVEFTSIDPKLAANGANTIIAEYLALQAAAKRHKTEDAALILEPEIAKLREEVAEAERRVEEFRAGADLLVGTNNLTLSQQQLGELTTQLATARSAKTQAETKARLVRDLIKNGRSLDTATDVLSSRLIQRLRERQVTLKAQLAELSTTLLPNHPRIKALKSQLADFDRQIRSEARKVLSGLENDAKIAAGRVSSLKASINELKAQSVTANEDQVRLRELQRDAKAKSGRLTTLLSRYREAESGRNARTLPADARVISRATIPPKPYWPKVVPITVIVTLATFIVLVSFVVIGQFINGDVLKPVAMPVAEPPEPVGAVPETAQIRWDEMGNLHRVMPDDAVHAARRTQFAHARDVWRRIPPGPDGKRLVTVTGAEPDADTHAAALSLARGLSASDEGRVVFVKLDGSGRQAENQNNADLPGMTNLLDGTASFAQVIFRDRASRTHIVPGGQRPLADNDFDGNPFRTILDALAVTYETVIADVGPLASCARVAEMLLQSDQVVLVTQGHAGSPSASVAYDALNKHGIAGITVVSADELSNGAGDGDLSGAAA